ncbi:MULTISPECIES: hypothetical protein [Lactobacillus]|uniref:hypothetical protein n=1 Tax=Lactobacillus TaxID=1578 RepID=UPI001F29E3D2|nr:MULTISPECIES: hypothetical protein [Lactobacillus]
MKKTPALKKYEFHTNWKSTAYTDAVQGTNGYKLAWHYTNLLNRDHRSMGMAHMTHNDYGYIDSFNASSYGKGSISLSQYKKLVNQWLN